MENIVSELIKKSSLIAFALVFINASGFAFSDSTYVAEFVIPISHADDDTEQEGNGNIYFGSTDIELSYDPDHGNQTIGLRFQNVLIPSNVTIQEAYIQFTVDEYSTGNCNLSIEAEATDDASPFTSTFQDISNRVLTSANIAWTPENWTVIDQADELQRSPNIAPVIQEVTERMGWNQGNAINIIIKGSGTRTARAYETNPEQAAKLILKVELPLPQSPISGLYINELMASNGLYFDEHGEADDWIELYNGSNDPIQLGGLFISDDPDDLKKWQIAAPIDLAPNDFAVIWADDEPLEGGLHASFKLKSEGETVILSQFLNDELTILDQITYPEVPLNLSYGRKQDAANEWIIFGGPTLNSSNNDSGFFMDQVTFSLTPGMYQGSQSLTMTSPLPDATIRYTTDGSMPDETDNLYTAPLVIDETVSIRASAFKTDYAPGKLATATYIIDPNHDIPVFSISTDPKNLWDDQIGIYVQGTNGVPGWCMDAPVNWNQDWERPASIAMYEADGSLAFQKEGGIKIGGGCSRTQSQKSFNLYIRPNTYGDEKIEYPVFPGHEVTEFQRLKLRDGGQDFGAMIIRDGLNQSLLRDQVDLDLMAYRPAAVYLNGEYWGLYGIREFYTKHHLINHYGVEEGNIDMLVNSNMAWGDIKEGDKVAFNALHNYFESNDLSIQGAYEYVTSQIDIEEFLNYHIVQIYIANYDWPSNNVITWKPRDGGKWRWMLFDTDASTNFPLWAPSYPEFNSLVFATSTTSTDWPNHRNSTLFLRKLFQNIGFRNEYIQRTCTFMETIYADERVIHFTDSIAAMVENEMPAHIDKWGNWNNYGWGITAHGDINEWRNNLQEFKDFFNQRRSPMLNHIRGYFNLGNRSILHLNHDSESQGEVYFHSNEMRMPYQHSAVYFNDIPIKIKAVADPGYSFLKWEETGDTNAEINFILTGEFTLTPIFVKNNVFLTEIHFAPEQGEDYEFVELYNPTDFALDISGYTLSGTVDFTFPSGTKIAGTSYILVVKDKDNFEDSDCVVYQWTSGNLDNQTGTLTIKNAFGDLINEVTYDTNFPYFNDALTSGKSLHLLDLALDNKIGQNWIALPTTTCAKGIDYLPYSSETFLFELYPNPASGQINIRYAQAQTGPMTISIFNSVGQLVHQEFLRGEAYQKSDLIAIPNLAAGVYVFKLESGMEGRVLKVVIQ